MYRGRRPAGSLVYLLNNGTKESRQLCLEDDNVDHNALSDTSEEIADIANERSSSCRAFSKISYG